MAEKATTLFIRDDAVNLLVVEGKRVRKWASLPLEPGLVSQGLVLDEARVADGLNKLFKLAKIRTRRVVAGLSGLNSLYRLISLPELPDAILPEAVKQEAKRVIPVPLDEVYLSYQRLPAPAGETRVFLAVFPRNVADVLIRTMRQAGIQPYIMDLAPLALCRTLNEPRAIIINTRLDHLDIMVMEDRLPQLIHRLSLAGEVTSAPERLSAITEEIDRTIAFYNSSHGENPLDSTVPLFVCSDLAQLPEGWQSLGGKLGCPVSILPSPVESPDGFDPSDFMVNIGLALKRLQQEREGANFSVVNFNALPEVYLPKRVSLASILTRVGIIAGIGLLIGMGFLVINRAHHISTLRSQLSSAQSHIAMEAQKMATLQEQIKNVEAQLKTVAAKAEVLDTKLTSLEASRDLVSHDLTESFNVVPVSIYFNAFHHGDDSVTVGGVAPTEDDIFSYARDLRDKFGNVVISLIKAREEPLEEFGWIRGFEFELLLRW